MTLNGDASVKASADVFNQPHPFLSDPNILTVYPDSKLYQENRRHNDSVFETKNKKIEIRNNSSDDMLDDKILNIPTYFTAKGAKIHSRS